MAQDPPQTRPRRNARSPRSKKQPAPRSPNGNGHNRWTFFAAIKLLLSAFPHATVGQQVIIVAMSFAAVMFIGLGLVGSVALPAWAVVVMFVVGVVLILATAWMLFLVEQRVAKPVRCRHVPVYPPETTTRQAIKAALEEIREDAVLELQKKYPAMANDRVRANIFMLAQIVGGPADGTWKLVIHPDFAINMRHPPELQLQLSVGQGASGVSYRDGTYLLTRRLPDPEHGDWEEKFHMTPSLSEQIHKNLKWIVTFPLLRPGTSEALGVLNIDGLADVPDDNLLNEMASSVQKKIEVIANHLALQRSTCVGLDLLGVM